MKTLNDCFEKIYCVNLERRPERWDICKEVFSQYNINVERYEAVDGTKHDRVGKMSHGEVGCLLSHLNILKKCKEDNVSNVLILEDDVEFCSNFDKLFSEYIKEVPEWDILYLGATHALCYPYMNRPPIKVTDHVYKVYNAHATHAYAINSSCYDLLIDFVSKMEGPLDVIYTKLQSYLRTYIFRPHLAWQRSDFSDIAGKHVNYDFLKR
jgi:GR25 family glycosyltransferase involved in LPS biosynthesis